MNLCRNSSIFFLIGCSEKIERKIYKILVVQLSEEKGNDNCKYRKKKKEINLKFNHEYFVSYMSTQSNFMLIKTFRQHTSTLIECLDKD